MKTAYLHNLNLNVNLEEILEELDITFISKDDDVTPNFIIYTTESDLFELEELYNLKIGEIQLIFIGELKEKDRFFISGGSLFLSEKQIESEVGIKILKRLVEGNSSLKLQDRIEEDSDSVIITNHLQTGLYFDRIATSAFEKDFNPLLIRTYLDHSIAYFTYLTQCGLGSIPFEVEWSSDGDEFIINSYLKVKNFSKDYLIDCLGEIGHDKALSYLLTVVVNSCEHLDINFYEKSSRLCFTSYLGKSKKPRLTSSVLIDNISTFEQTQALNIKKVDSIEKLIESTQRSKTTSAEIEKKELPHGFLVKAQFDSEQLVENPEKTKKIIETLIRQIDHNGESLQSIEGSRLAEIISTMPQEDQIENLSNESITQLQSALRSSKSSKALQKEIESHTLIKSEELDQSNKETLVEEVISKTSESLDREAIRSMLLEDENKVVKGSKKKKENFKSVIKGEKEKPEIITRIKGEFTDLADNFMQVVKSSPSTEDKRGLFRNLIDSKVSALSKTVPNFNQNNIDDYIEEVLPREIELGLDDYAKSIGKTFVDLDEDDLSSFQKRQLPKIIDSLTENEEVVEEFASSMDIIGQSTVDLNFREKLRSKIKGSESLEDYTDDQLNSIVKSTLKDTLTPDIEHIREATQDQDQQSKLLAQLVEGVVSNDEKASDIVADAVKSTEVIQAQVAPNAFKMNQEVDSTSKSSLEKELLEKLKVEKLAKVQAQRQLSLVKGQLESLQSAQRRVEKVQQRINEKVESEKDNVDLSSNNDEDLTAKLKKLELESRHKDSLFNSEITKIERVLKGKEIILEKTQKSFEAKVQDLIQENNKLKEMVKSSDQGNAASEASYLKKQLRTLKKDNELLAKNSSVIKSRLEAISKGKETSKSESELDGVLSDNRKLKALKNEYVNKYQAVEKEKKALESKLSSIEYRESKSRDEAIKAHQKFNELEAEMRKFKQTDAQRIKEASQSSAKDHDSMLAKEFNSVKAQNLQLQKKLKEVMDKAKASSASNGKSNLSAKERHLEKDKQRLQTEVKKHRSDLDDAKKIVMKYKGENIKMKNELEKLKRDKDRVEKKLKSLASASGKKAA